MSGWALALACLDVKLTLNVDFQNDVQFELKTLKKMDRLRLLQKHHILIYHFYLKVFKMYHYLLFIISLFI